MAKPGKESEFGFNHGLSLTVLGQQIFQLEGFLQGLPIFTKEKELAG
jgi:hypothetical protein